MAIWQFDMHAVPRIAVERSYGAMPLKISMEEFDSVEWWSGLQMPHDIHNDVGRLLPRMHSWHPELDQWGSDGGNRIDLHRHGAGLSSMMVRIDLRMPSIPFMVGVLGIARKHDWLFRASTGAVLTSSLARLLSEIRASRAFAFVNNPHEFPEELGKASDLDPPHDP